jgi:acetolactate synthase-1/3 small subunit
MKEQTQIIATIVEHKPGVLYEVANMFRRRNFNIESISVGPIEPADLARMTLTVKGDEKTIEQVIKQMNKLVHVIKVSILEPATTVQREMALIKVHTSDSKTRSEVIQYADIFRGRIVDVASTSLTIEVTGNAEKIDAFIDLTRIYGIKEVARTGITALARGAKVIREELGIGKRGQR